MITPIQYLLQTLEEYALMAPTDEWIGIAVAMDTAEALLEYEKKCIMDACVFGGERGPDWDKIAEQYYYETFGGKE